MFSDLSIKAPPYTILKKHDTFEIRRYARMIQAQIDRDGNGGFRVLANYIFGGNNRNEKIEMTAPVYQWDGNMAFVMPKKYTLQRLPQPLNPNVSLKVVDDYTVAALTFTWLTPSSRVERLAKRFKKSIQDAGYSIIGPYRLAVYNNPMSTLPFLRRNEIHFPIRYDGLVSPPTGSDYQRHQTGRVRSLQSD